MITIKSIALILGVIICLIIAPFMTIGIIFILSSYVVLNWLGFIFFILGMVHMIARWSN